MKLVGQTIKSMFLKEFKNLSHYRNDLKAFDNMFVNKKYVVIDKCLKFIKK